MPRAVEVARDPRISYNPARSLDVQEIRGFDRSPGQRWAGTTNVHITDKAGKILIIGAGPTGLGAAWRLQEAGGADWELFERDGQVGGLASSYLDENGFTWDIGGHVVFSHYEYFDALLDSLLKDEWVQHVREAWVWMRERFIPYPLQNNIRHLPVPELQECIAGLQDAQCRSAGSPATFADWLQRSFGPGLTRAFMDPYNRKVWATDPAEMSVQWVRERVATVDIERIRRNIAAGRDDLGWGPNATFRFPLRGGTGRIWNAIAERLPAGRVHLGAEVTEVDAEGKTVRLSDGRTACYDWLITTMPMDVLLRRMGNSRGASCPPSLATRLRYSSTHVVGVGMDGPAPPELATKCWIYFPEPELLFYRVTVFSNYSPHNVPNPGRQWSLMAEVSEAADEPSAVDVTVGQAVDGLKAARLIPPGAAISSIWHKRVEHGYPIPSLDRDALLDRIEPALYARNVLSRGRFGAWKYEVGNMDHSFMQGVEAANHILFGEPETTLRGYVRSSDNHRR